ncbi:hypothetical protein D3C79_1024160 [compost metagenome]
MAQLSAKKSVKAVTFIGYRLQIRLVQEREPAHRLSNLNYFYVIIGYVIIGYKPACMSVLHRHLSDMD